MFPLPMALPLMQISNCNFKLNIRNINKQTKIKFSTIFLAIHHEWNMPKV